MLCAVCLGGGCAESDVRCGWMMRDAWSIDVDGDDDACCMFVEESAWTFGLKYKGKRLGPNLACSNAHRSFLHQLARWQVRTEGS